MSLAEPRELSEDRPRARGVLKLICESFTGTRCHVSNII